jgi:DNA-binding MarR family transcriptional regulator
MVIFGNDFIRYYFMMNRRAANQSADATAAAVRAHMRATSGGKGDIAIYILVRSCNAMLGDRLDRLVEPHGLGPAGYITLMALFNRPEHRSSPSELSDYTGETRANMTRICDELVEQGWIQRAPNAHDRRRIDLALTDAGLALLKDVAPGLRANAEEFYRRTFTKTEKASLHQLLTQFASSLAADR